MDDTNDLNPNDISYVYSGYAPLSIRLVQCVTQKNAVLSAGIIADDEPSENPSGRKRRDLPRAHPIAGWKGFEDVLASIPGATVEMRQRMTEGDGRLEARMF